MLVLRRYTLFRHISARDNVGAENEKEEKEKEYQPCALCRLSSPASPPLHVEALEARRPTSYCMAECAGTSYVAHALAVAQGLVPQWARIFGY